MKLRMLILELSLLSERMSAGRLDTRSGMRAMFLSSMRPSFASSSPSVHWRLEEIGEAEIGSGEVEGSAVLESRFCLYSKRETFFGGGSIFGCAGVRLIRVR